MQWPLGEGPGGTLGRTALGPAEQTARQGAAARLRPFRLSGPLAVARGYPMTPTSLFTAALGPAPWGVADVAFDPQAGRIDFRWLRRGGALCLSALRGRASASA